MIIKRYKNGNMTAKMEKEDYNKESTLVNLIWALYDVDCTIFGEEYCLSNYEMGLDMYNYYTGKLYCIPYSLLDDLEKGKTIRLYARDLNEYDLEEYNRLMELEEI